MAVGPTSARVSLLYKKKRKKRVGNKTIVEEKDQFIEIIPYLQQSLKKMKMLIDGIKRLEPLLL